MLKTKLLLTFALALIFILTSCVTPPPAPTPLQPAPPSPPPSLAISARILDSRWIREDDDLPAYQVYVEVSVSDIGGEPALVNLMANYPLSGTMLTTFNLSPQSGYRYNHQLSFRLGTSADGWITYTANSAKANAACQLFIPASPLPRWRVGPEVLKLYITPNNSYIRQLLNQILASKPLLRTDFGAIQEWVDFNVAYRSDSSRHGVSDYWQLPFETASLKSGDCEDYAILLCSLLRAYGIPAEKVYVAVGLNVDGTTAHAYLIEHWYYGKWRVIEPQSSFPLLTDIESWLTDLQYDDVFYFNDLYYFQVK